MTKVDNPDEIQFRQIHPDWIQDDEPSRQAFIPTKKDDGKLSLARSILTSAEKAFQNYIALGLRSSAVYGLSVSEFEEEPAPIKCYASPLSNNPHHSHADFSGLSKSQKKIKSQELRRLAINRGKIFP